VHHTEPVLWTSAFDPPFGLTGGPTGSATLFWMCWNVIGFFVMSSSKGTGARRSSSCLPPTVDGLSA
jgi:hypothetical protein